MLQSPVEVCQSRKIMTLLLWQVHWLIMASCHFLIRQRLQTIQSLSTLSPFLSAMKKLPASTLRLLISHSRWLYCSAALFGTNRRRITSLKSSTLAPPRRSKSDSHRWSMLNPRWSTNIFSSQKKYTMQGATTKETLCTACLLLNNGTLKMMKSNWFEALTTNWLWILGINRVHKTEPRSETTTSFT